MARYIDAEDLKRVINANDWSNPVVPQVVCTIIDRTPTADVVPTSEAEKWYNEYHVIKDELKRERMEHRATDKLADRYCAELQKAKTDVAAVKHGEWSLMNRCPFCRYKNNKETKFCPNCGARLERYANKEAQA